MRENFLLKLNANSAPFLNRVYFDVVMTIMAVPIGSTVCWTINCGFLSTGNASSIFRMAIKSKGKVDSSADRLKVSFSRRAFNSISATLLSL